MFTFDAFGPVLIQEAIKLEFFRVLEEFFIEMNRVKIAQNVGAFWNVISPYFCLFRGTLKKFRVTQVLVQVATHTCGMLSGISVPNRKTS